MGLLTGSWLLDALLVLLTLVYWYMTRNNSFWKKLGVPYMKPTIFVGNMGGLVTGRQHLGDPVYECYLKAADNRFMGMFAFDQPLLMVKDLELVGRVLSSDFSSFYRLNFTLADTEDSVAGRSIFAVNGPRWKTLRSVLSPGFTSGKMKRMFHLVNECGQDLVEHLQAATENGSSVDVRELMTCYTTDVVSSVFVGVKGGSLQNSNSPMRQSVQKIIRDDFVGRLANAMNFLAPKLVQVFGINIVRKEFEDYLIKTTEEAIEYRKKNGVVREDTIDLLMRVRDGQTEDSSGHTKRLTDDAGEEFRFDSKDVAAQVLTFLLAGFETSASTLMFTLYELALNQEIQEQIRQQVKQVAAKHGGITYEALAEFTELNNAVSEALRMYPVVNVLDRRSTRDYPIPGTSVVLPKGTGVLISVLGLHYDPRYWEQPHRFMPQRFNKENSKDRPNYTYLPFGDGPRQCIGMRNGLMQVRIGLAYILNNFSVSPTAATPVPLTLDTGNFIVRPKDSLPLHFQRLSTK